MYLHVCMYVCALYYYRKFRLKINTHIHTYIYTYTYMQILLHIHFKITTYYYYHLLLFLVFMLRVYLILLVMMIMMLLILIMMPRYQLRLLAIMFIIPKAICYTVINTYIHPYIRMNSYVHMVCMFKIHHKYYYFVFHLIAFGGHL